MLVKRMSQEALLDPSAAAWSSVPEESIALAGTPLASQPNRYIRNSWKDQSVGAVKEVRVRAAHDGQAVFFRLEWQDANENRKHDEGAFPDAAAVIFPLDGEAPLDTMGSAEHPVNAWFWRPDIEEEPQNLTARGLATVQEAPAPIQARSAWQSGVWSVVISRPLASNGDSVKLAPGGKTSIAVAVWEGGARERGGLKAYSQSWRELQVDA